MELLVMGVGVDWQELGRPCEVQPGATQRLGAWQEVFRSQVAGRQGPSGMSLS